MLQFNDLRVDQRKEPCIRVNPRKLNGVFGIMHLPVVATTYHKGQMISLTSKLQSRSMMWEFTRELDKKSLLN